MGLFSHAVCYPCIYRYSHSHTRCVASLFNDFNDLLQKCRKLDAMTWRFVLLMALFRGLYMLNWIHQSHYGFRYSQYCYKEVYAASGIQVALYCRFFWYYYRRSRLHCYSSSSSNEKLTRDASAAAVAAQRMHVPAVLLNDDAVRTKELLEPLQPRRIQPIL
jgi:hypothetical protein